MRGSHAQAPTAARAVREIGQHPVHAIQRPYRTSGPMNRGGRRAGAAVEPSAAPVAHSAVTCCTDSAAASCTRICAATSWNATRAASRQRHGIASLGDRLGVVMHAVDPEFKMQMRAGGPAGGADSTQIVALAHDLAQLHTRF